MLETLGVILICLLFLVAGVDFFFDFVSQMDEHEKKEQGCGQRQGK